jgi:hypothetical protein
MKVKYMGGPPSAAPKAVNKAVIEGQGSVPFAALKAMATPSTERGSRTTGQKRGMGAAERSGRYTSV